MIYISHLDLIRLFQRALRRAEMPIALTNGFNPHPRMSITPALKLGQSSLNQEAYFYLTEPLSPEKFKNKLQVQLPEGIDILEVEDMSVGILFSETGTPFKIQPKFQ